MKCVRNQNLSAKFEKMTNISVQKVEVVWLHLQRCLVLSWCGASRSIWDGSSLWGTVFLLV